jgi:hypothetical protein
MALNEDPVCLFLLQSKQALDSECKEEELLSLSLEGKKKKKKRK